MPTNLPPAIGTGRIIESLEAHPPRKSKATRTRPADDLMGIISAIIEPMTITSNAVRQRDNQRIYSHSRRNEHAKFIICNLSARKRRHIGDACQLDTPFAAVRSRHLD